jgi:hypothetical protein
VILADQHRRVGEGVRQPAAVAVVRVWIDDERPGSLKIRISGVSRLGEQAQEIGVTTSIDEAVGQVATWLRAFAAEHAAH